MCNYMTIIHSFILQKLEAYYIWTRVKNHQQKSSDTQITLVKLLLQKQVHHNKTQPDVLSNYSLVNAQHHLLFIYSSHSIFVPQFNLLLIFSLTFLTFFGFSVSKALPILWVLLWMYMNTDYTNRIKLQSHFTKGYSRFKDEQVECNFAICCKD